MRPAASGECTSTDAISTKPARQELLVSGLLTGALAGLAMAVFISSAAAMEGYGFLAPLRAMGALFADPERADAGGAARLALGLAFQLGTSVLLATAFLSIVPRDFPVGSAMVVAVAYGLAAGCVMAAYLLPAVNPVLRGEMPEMGGSWVIAYATFGLALGLGPLIRRLLTRRAARPRERAPAVGLHEGAAVRRRASADRSA